MTKRGFSRFISAVLSVLFILGGFSQFAFPVNAETGNYVTSVTYKSNGVELQPNADGSYSVTLGEDYEIDLEFSESENNQFPDDQFTYQLPSGITPAQASSGTFDITFQVVNSDGTLETKTLSGNQYTISTSGRITVKWNTNGGEAYSAFLDCANVSFTLMFSGSFNGESTQLTFNDSVETTITVDNSSYVSISKSGVYNPSTNKVEYTATVKGAKGTNTNVVVTDTLSGTALTLDTDSIQISKTPETAADPTQTSVSEDGFTYNIATVNEGDEYTFTYTASVNVDGVTGSGTVEQTENDISVTSTENTDPVTDTTDLEDAIPYTDVSKAVEIESEDDNNILLKWTITYGDADNAASLAGFTLTDTLPWKSSRLTYDTTNHTGITVQENNETAYTVLWADVGVTAGNENSWSWTIPENAEGNTVYTITYYTVYDTSDMVSGEYVSNTISDGHGHSFHKGINIGTGDISITKHLSDISFTDGTADWTITITVPAAGLKTAYIVDYYPHKSFNGRELYDTLVSGSITVDGLLEGETYTLLTGQNRFRMNFSSGYTDSDGNAYALGPSSESRTITITLQTNINEEWIELSKDLEDSSKRNHTNGAWFYANDKRITDQDMFSTNPSAIDKTVSNDGYPVGYYSSPYDSQDDYSDTADSDTDLPVWKFRISLDGVYGDITITDKFDTDLFDIVPAEAEEDDNRRVTGRSFWNYITSYTDVDGNESKVTVTPTSDGATLYISADDLPKYHDDPDLFYTRYYVDYYLRVKSPEALQELRNICAEQGTSLTAALTNEVTSDGNTDTETFYYTYEGVQKEIVNEGYVDEDGYTYADFKIVLNPTAADLDSNSDTLEASDTWSSSLAVKPDSFAFTDSSGNDISDSVSYDISGRTASFTIPDATAVTITYRARIIGTGQIDYSNTATMYGYVSGDSASATVSSSGEGSGSIFTIYLLKYAQGNMNDHLEGAVFSLYRLNSQGSKVPVTDIDGNVVSFTTDSEGEAVIFGSQSNDGWTLNEGVQYYLHEETAPVGYAKLSSDFAFQVSDTSQDWDNHLYLNGDTILIPNQENEAFSFTKVWLDGNGSGGIRPSSDPESGSFFGNWLHLYETIDGTTTELTGYTPTITVDQDDSSIWTVSYTDLPETDGSYSVKEVIPDGISYTADYGGGEYVTDGGTLTNRDSTKVSIPVEKKWEDGARGSSAVIVLTADGVKTGMSIELNEGNSWKSSFDELPKYSDEGTEIEYGVVEETDEWSYTVNSDGKGGFIVTNYPKNHVPKTGDISHTGAFALVMGIALSGTVCLVMADRRRRKE